MDFKKFGEAIVLIGFFLALGAGFFWIKQSAYEDSLSEAKARDALAHVKGEYWGYPQTELVTSDIRQAEIYRNYLAFASVIVLMIGIGLKKSAYSNQENVYKCPYCAELIKADAKICRHCQRDLTEES